MKFALPTCSRRPVLRRNPRSMKCCDSSHAWADSSLARAMANPARKPSGRDSQPYASPQKQCVCYVTTVVATLATLAYKDMLPGGVTGKTINEIIATESLSGTDHNRL